ncbi:MAG: sigma-70 family RNA polymerase sigma factor [Bacteroidales bacterium]|nr:sigma-70 family RNA polymerase sigma factor [Bacteroidales bacterium]
MVHYTQYGIIEGIRRKDKDVLRFVYKQYLPMVRYFVIKNKGTEEDAQDLFQEAMVAVYQRVRKRDLNLDCSFKTYLYSVVRHMWLQAIERKRIHYEFTEMDEFILLEENELYEDFQLKKGIYQRHFFQLTGLCQKILIMFVERVPFEEIAAIIGYKGRQYAIKRKYECMKSLINRVINDPEYKSLNQ